MPDYLVGCVDKSSPFEGHQHIVTIGIAGIRVSVKEARELIDKGDTFHTMSPRAEVEKFTCPLPCGYETLRSCADAIPANNLDNLPACKTR